MKKLAIVLLGVAFVLAGCGDKASNHDEKKTSQTNKQDKTTEKQHDKTETVTKTTGSATQKEDTTATVTKTNKANDNQQPQANQNANQKQRQAQSSIGTSANTGKPQQTDQATASQIALAFFGNNIDKYSLTHEEILKGSYEYQGPGTTSKRKVEQLTLKRSQNIPNAPQGMKFYYVLPAKGNFATVIGVSDDKIFVGGTQGALTDYQQMLASGKEMSAKNLQAAYQNDPELEKVTQKITITFKSDDAFTFYGGMA
ncbi:TPA: hypothetical protein R1916_002072 [Staphylococcus delphini]|nr:hypothetical protein [Staphylococcus delphini]